jgi:flagellar hook-associated protein 1 FlgK
MSALTIGLSGLLVDQRLLDLTGQNITNANTPNYHRQVANLAESVSGTGSSAVGSGVEITGITRTVNQLLEQAVVTNTSASNNASTQLNGLNQLQSFLATGSGSLHDALGNLFTQLEALSPQPDDPTQRQPVLSAANDVTTQLNGTVDNLNQLSSGLYDQGKTQVDTINTLTAQIAQLNQQIHDGTVGGGDTNGLLDQRDQAVANLSQLIDVRTLVQPNGEISVFTSGTPLVLNSQASALNLSVNSQKQLVVNVTGSSEPITVSGGSLGGILALTNTILPAVGSQLDSFTRALVTQFDHIQSTGLGLNGPMTALTSQRTVTDTNRPLDAANLAFPPSAGDLYITVTNLATGQRTLNKVPIDPKTQSLASIATAISAVPNMQAVVDPQAGTLNLLAKPGYGFDFTGNLSNSPDAQAITGTTVPTISGQYTGTRNDTLKFSFAGSGTIGATPNLTLDVRDGAGTLLGSLNVGQGYSPGTALAAAMGVKVNLAAGTVNAGDSFSVNATSDPDSARLLPALGLNTFFVGDSAAGLQVNPNLVNQPAQLALSTSGQPGDGSNLTKLVALQTQPVLANQTQSLQQYLENVIGGVGTQVNDTQTQSTAYASLGLQLNDQLQSASGVDPNEELIQLVQYQRSYQMSAQFVSTVNQTIDDLLKLVI